MSHCKDHIMARCKAVVSHKRQCSGVRVTFDMASLRLGTSLVAAGGIRRRLIVSTPFRLIKRAFSANLREEDEELDAEEADLQELMRLSRVRVPTATVQPVLKERLDALVEGLSTPKSMPLSPAVGVTRLELKPWQ